MSKNQIPSVKQGMIQVESGSVIKADSTKWWEWVEGATSFRYVPTGSTAPFTVRKERGTKGQQSYWYGYRKTSGKLCKRYIGKNEDLSVTRLEEVAHELSTPNVSPKKTKVTQSESVTQAEPKSLTQSEEQERLQKEIERLQTELQNALKKAKA